MSCNLLKLLQQKIFAFFTKKTTDANTQTKKKKKRKRPEIKSNEVKVESEKPSLVKEEEEIPEPERPIIIKAKETATKGTRTGLSICTLRESEATLSKLYLKDDNFLILNPNFASKASSSLTAFYDTSQQCSFDEKIERILRKHCQNRRLGNAKCHCKLCSTLAVLRDSLKHSGPFDWELPKPTLSKTLRGKYVTPSSYAYSVNESSYGNQDEYRTPDVSFKQVDSAEGNMESLIYFRIEQKMKRLKNKIDEIRDNMEDNSNYTIESIECDSGNVRPKNLVMKNVKFYAEGTMNVVGKPRTRRKPKEHKSNSSREFSRIGS